MSEARKCDCCGVYFDELPFIKCMENGYTYKNCQIKLSLNFGDHLIRIDLCPKCMQEKFLDIFCNDGVGLYVEEPKPKDL